MSTDEEKRPGTHMVTTAAILLFILGTGLLAVSFAAQYSYVVAQRHQHAASLIEAGALDIGMLIFSLLALGLARAGLAAKTERALILACAAGSAVMNYAAADVSSPRSVLAYCMPPVFLAVVADRVVVTVRRHVLGMRESASPWAVAGRAGLYGLRAVLDPWTTVKGVRRMVLDAAPLPSAPPAAIPPGDAGPAPEDARPGAQEPEPLTPAEPPEPAARKPRKTTPRTRAEKHAEAERIFAAEPSIAGAELARRCGVSDRTGQNWLADMRRPRLVAKEG